MDCRCVTGAVSICIDNVAEEHPMLILVPIRLDSIV